MNVETYDLFAALLAYPSDATKAALNGCGASLHGFAHQVGSMPMEQWQELYVQTFDLNPKCSLEVGWQLYGENYARGEFLVATRQALRRLEVDESTELPDHLTHVLAAFGRMEAKEASPFAAECLLPALEKMRSGLSGPYAELLAAIQAIVRAAHPAARGSEVERTYSLPVIEPSELASEPLAATELEACHG